MPTFQFFQSGKKKHEFSGADARQLRQVISQMAAKAESRGTFVGVEVTTASLEAFYAKHDPDKRGDAQKTAKKFARKAAKLMQALQEKYDDVPELAPEGAEEESRRPKKARKGDSGGSGGKALSDWELHELQTELLATMQQVLRVAELPPTTGGGRGDRQVRRLLTQYKTYLRETRVSVLKAELSKLATRSTETIPQAAELAETRTYVEMAAMLEEAVQAL